MATFKKLPNLLLVVQRHDSFKPPICRKKVDLWVKRSKNVNMTNKHVLSNIYNKILEASSTEIQMDYWITGKSGLVSSYVELMCSLFDSYFIEEFVEKDAKELGLSSEFILELGNLIAMLDEYDERDKPQLEIIKDPRWISITNQAKRVIEYWVKEFPPSSYLFN